MQGEEGDDNRKCMCLPNPSLLGTESNVFIRARQGALPDLGRIVYLVVAAKTA